MTEFLEKFREHEDQEICFGRLMEVMQDYLLSIRVQIGQRLIAANGGSGLSLELCDENGALAVVFPEPLHIPADHEHQFRFNVNTISGPM
ncbi:hypothetical protein [Aeromonas hydrophila]|uniref:hypothetical protein n=1 Tax=Aeromonas hydrophila TaxID=644 RepID=UPI003EC71D96